MVDQLDYKKGKALIMFLHLTAHDQGQEVPYTGQSLLLNALYNYIPLHVRGGSVIPMQTPNTTTTQRYVSTPLV